MSINQYKLTADKFGWAVYKNGVMVAGFTINLNNTQNLPSYLTREFHTDTAKQFIIDQL